VGWTCPTCGETAAGRYCSACGEARDAAARRRLRDTLRAPWTSRLRASLAALGSPPGRLTRDWLAGRRVGYLAPLTLFFYVNVAFFVIQSASHVSILAWPYAVHLDNDGLGIDRFLVAWLRGPHFAADPTRIAVFNAMEDVYAKALVVVMLPIVAVAALAAPTPRRAGFAATFAFVAHYFTFALIALSALFPLVSIVLTLLVASGIRPSPDVIDHVVTSIQMAMLLWFVTRAYAMISTLPLWRRLPLAALYVGATWVALRIYHVVVFAVTLALM
jgi:hypothetical protein